MTACRWVGEEKQSRLVPFLAWVVRVWRGHRLRREAGHKDSVWHSPYPEGLLASGPPIGQEELTLIHPPPNFPL